MPRFKHLMPLAMLVTFHFRSGAQELYDLSKVQEVRIYFPYSDWDRRLDSLHAADPDARLTCSYVLLNGQRLDSAGIRYKGNSTYNATRIKNPINIRLDHVIRDQNYQGFSTIKLSNGFMDPSLLREVMGYFISRQYMPASRANFMRVYVNDIYLGLYTNVEPVSSDFLSRYFYSDNNAFFQCDRPDKPVNVPSSCQPANQGSALRYGPTDSACYYGSYEIQSDHGWSSLLGMMNRLNANPATVDQLLNVDRSLWMLALNNYFVNLDSYSGSGHNYLVYEDENGIFQPILWDLNEFYGAFTNTGAGQVNISQMRTLDPLLHLSNPDRPLISRLLSLPSYKKRYLAHLKTILSEAEAAGFYKTQGTGWQNLIRQAAREDRNKFFNDTAFEQNLNADYSIPNGPNGSKTYPGLTKFAGERRDFLKNNPNLNVLQPTITNHIPSVQAKNDTADFLLTASAADADKVYWYYRFRPQDPFKRLEMLDNGIDDDGIAGNGIYGRHLRYRASSELQYYLYAENAGMAALLPPRAEYEFFRQPPSYVRLAAGDLLINEVMSSNSAYAADETGEFDDWIELFNPGDDRISLSGLYLSDNENNLLKWGFPDTTIAKKSYLVIWADEDGGDPGLHANFKLSRSGEKLHVVNHDSSIVDFIDIPELQEDESYGRCDGKLLHMSRPSIGRANSCASSVDEGTPVSKFRIAPNPSNGHCVMTFAIPGEYRIRVSSLEGKTVSEYEISVIPGKNEEYPLTLEAEGLFNITVQCNTGFRESVRVINFR